MIHLFFTVYLITKLVDSDLESQRRRKKRTGFNITQKVEPVKLQFMKRWNRTKY